MARHAQPEAWGQGYRLEFSLLAGKIKEQRRYPQMDQKSDASDFTEMGLYVVRQWE